MNAKRKDVQNETVRQSRGRSDDGNAFLPDPTEGNRSATDVDLAEELAEAFVAGATSNDDVASNEREAVLTEEIGGPFLTEATSDEVALGTDASNPSDATREPFPTAMRAPH
jgi:phosphoenolpyruvate synthase/pyruvate phosphate dikinase